MILEMILKIKIIEKIIILNHFKVIAKNMILRSNSWYWFLNICLVFKSKWCPTLEVYIYIYIYISKCCCRCWRLINPSSLPPIASLTLRPSHPSSLPPIGVKWCLKLLKQMHSLCSHRANCKVAARQYQVAAHQ